MRDPREVLGKVGIVGAGGGLRGAAIAGFLGPIIRHKIPIDYLGAVSVSALMFARLSEAQDQSELSGLLKDINSIWNYIEKHGREVVFPYSSAHCVKRVWDGHSCLENDSLFWLIKNFDPRRSVSSPIRFEFFVFDEKRNEHRVISNHDELFVKDPSLLPRAVVGSASFKPIFDQIEVGDEMFSDGGFVEPWRAFEYGCDTVFVLYPHSEEHRKPPQPNGFLAKHTRAIKGASDDYSRVLRLLDDYTLREAMLRIESHNENQKISALMDNVARLRPGGDWFDRFIGRVDSLKKKFGLSTQTALSNKKKRIIPLYGEIPPTLSLDESGPGDILETRKKAECRMERVVHDLLI